MFSLFCHLVSSFHYHLLFFIRLSCLLSFLLFSSLLLSCLVSPLSSSLVLSRLSSFIFSCLVSSLLFHLLLPSCLVSPLPSSLVLSRLSSFIFSCLVSSCLVLSCLVSLSVSLFFCLSLSSSCVSLSLSVSVSVWCCVLCCVVCVVCVCLVCVCVCLCFCVFMCCGTLKKVEKTLLWIQKRARVYVQNVPVCTCTTRTCWNTCSCRGFTLVRNIGTDGTFGYAFEFTLTLLTLSFAITLRPWLALLAFAGFFENVLHRTWNTHRADSMTLFLCQIQEDWLRPHPWYLTVHESQCHSAWHHKFSNQTSPPRTSRLPGAHPRMFASDSS